MKTYYWDMCPPALDYLQCVDKQGVGMDGRREDITGVSKNKMKYVHYMRIAKGP